jgi:hypothetical protein
MNQAGDPPAEGWTYYPRPSLPRVNDIIWCRFPYHDNPGPGGKFRPVLVGAIAIDQDSDLRSAVLVAYGTTSLKVGRRPYDLTIQNAADMHQIGLAKATRFDLDLKIVLPWCEEFFAAPPWSSTFRIGRLNAAQEERLKNLVTRRKRQAELLARRAAALQAGREVERPDEL